MNLTHIHLHADVDTGDIVSMAQMYAGQDGQPWFGVIGKQNLLTRDEYYEHLRENNLKIAGGWSVYRI